MEEVDCLEKMTEYLRPTYFINSDSPVVINISKKITENLNDIIEKAKAIFYWTRDQIKYNPYESFSSRQKNYKASKIIQAGKGWCVQKACVLAALARSINIPSKLHFADIKNYKISGKLKEIMGTNLFVFHGYTELFLNGKWIKATPAFNVELSKKYNYIPAEFDGINDIVLPKTTINGEKFIEYVNDRGSYSDLPFKKMFKILHQYYEFV